MSEISKNAAALLCMEPEVSKLEESQRQALHVMKFEMLASLHRLYEKIHPDIAEPIVKRKLYEALFGEPFPKD